MQQVFDDWLESFCEVSVDNNETVANLYESWSIYCLATGYHPTSKIALSKLLKDRGFKAVKHTPGQHAQRGFLGLALWAYKLPLGQGNVVFYSNRTHRLWVDAAEMRKGNVLLTARDYAASVTGKI